MQNRMARFASSSALMLRSLGKATQITLGQILTARTDDEFHSRRTRIVCTMGPSCAKIETLVKMIDAGMNVARLNFSHGTHESHGEMLQLLRKAMELRPNAHVAIMLDTKGPEIRTGMLKNGKAVHFSQGQIFELTCDYTHVGDEMCIACSYEKLPQSVEVGTRVLIADGALATEVVEILANGVKVRALNEAVVGERKNMNLPGVKVELPCISEKDRNDIVNFGIKWNVPFVAASFVQNGDDVRQLRELIQSSGGNMKIISKIENAEGIVHFNDILNESDGIMVARGDLGMEIPPEKVFLAQKMAIAKCNVAGKPVITATQMLESMTRSPRPTRAEVADVANAVLDGTDCVMLSGETAGGQFPVESVQVMAATCLEAEFCIDYQQLYGTLIAAIPSTMEIPEGIARAAVSAANAVEASIIVVITQTGFTAQLVAKYRPAQVILALSTSEDVISHLCVFRGVQCLKIPSLCGADCVIGGAIQVAVERKLCESGDKAIAVYGSSEQIAGSSNIVKIIEIP